ncbi:hypothetical protein [Bordetella genomosp. 13]|uniref:hypothetical protein n=1 Tax=Bordetella genomosp. 13 TaxID=463040 RepID=UPI00119E0414|nr:hypothetical protein [Bordetella genomosp. 13]
MSLSDLRACVLVVGMALPAAVLAQAPAAPTGARTQPSACVDVEANGQRSPSYDCLSQQMAPRPPAPHENPALASEGVVRMAPNQVGLANRAATSNRMGSNFGHSAFPQRPTPIYTSPVGR